MITLDSAIYNGDKLYQARLTDGELGAIIKVYQPMRDGEWSPCSSWYLETLLDGGVSDSISIDYGQNWNITKGMKGVVAEALHLVLRGYEVPF